MKKPLRAIAILAAVLSLAAGALLLLVDANQFRGPIQRQLEQALARKVTLGGIGVRLMPLGVRVRDVEIAEDPAFGNTPFLKAAALDVRIGLAALLRGQADVQSLTVREPAVELRKNRQGEWNFSTLGGKKDPAAASSTGATQIAALRIEQGRLAVTDPGGRSLYENIDLALTGLGPGESFRAEGAMRMKGDTALKTTAEGRYQAAAKKLDLAAVTVELGSLRFTGQGAVDLAATPAQLDLRIRTANAPLEALAALGAFPAGTTIRGRLDADLHATGPAANPVFAGRLDAADVAVQQKGWPQPVTTPRLQIELTPERLTAPGFTVQSGQTSLRASATVRDYRGQPAIDATLTTSGAKLEELLRVAAAYGVSAANSIRGSGTASLELKIAMRGSQSDYSGSGSLDKATLEFPALAQPIGIETAQLRFTEDGMQVERLTASLAGSTVKGSLGLRNFAAPRLTFDATVDKLDAAAWQKLTRPDPTAAPAGSPKPAKASTPGLEASGPIRVGELRYNQLVFRNAQANVQLKGGVLDLEPLTAELYGGSYRGGLTADLRRDPAVYRIRTRLEKVDANGLVSATTSLKNVVYGMLGGDAEVEIAPQPGQDLGRGISGSLRFALGEGKLGGVNMLSELSRIAQFTGSGWGGGDAVTNILGLSGSLDIRDGKASTNDLKLSFAGGSLAASGSFGLDDQTLRLKVLSALDAAMSEKAGGTRVGGYMTTALTNAKGELVIPCQVAGTFSKPLFTPDVAEFARLKVQRVLPSKENPLGAVSDVIQGGKEGGAKGVGGALLDMLGGRKKKQ